jgi:hypothetical protein
VFPRQRLGGQIAPFVFTDGRTELGYCGAAQPVGERVTGVDPYFDYADRVVVQPDEREHRGRLGRPEQGTVRRVQVQLGDGEGR